MSATYPIVLGRSGSFLFTAHERKSKFRKAGTVIADCDRDLALWLVSSGHGRLWKGELPSNLDKIEYLDRTRAHSLQLEKNRRHNEEVLRYASAQQENENPET